MQTQTVRCKRGSSKMEISPLPCVPDGTTLKSGLERERARVEDDAAVKLKVSARLYDCFQHFLCWKSKDTGEWNLVPKN